MLLAVTVYYTMTGTPAEVEAKQGTDGERRLHPTSAGSEEEVRGTAKCQGEGACLPPAGKVTSSSVYHVLWYIFNNEHHKTFTIFGLYTHLMLSKDSDTRKSFLMFYLKKYKEIGDCN